MATRCGATYAARPHKLPPLPVPLPRRLTPDMACGLAQMPRKFNVAVSGSRDDFAHTHINDIGFQPHVHAKTGA